MTRGQRVRHLRDQLAACRYEAKPLNAKRRELKARLLTTTVALARVNVRRSEIKAQLARELRDEV